MKTLVIFCVLTSSVHAQVIDRISVSWSGSMEFTTNKTNLKYRTAVLPEGNYRVPNGAAGGHTLDWGDGFQTRNTRTLYQSGLRPFSASEIASRQLLSAGEFNSRVKDIEPGAALAENQVRQTEAIGLSDSVSVHSISFQQFPRIRYRDGAVNNIQEAVVVIRANKLSGVHGNLDRVYGYRGPMQEGGSYNFQHVGDYHHWSGNPSATLTLRAGNSCSGPTRITVTVLKAK